MSSLLQDLYTAQRENAMSISLVHYQYLARHDGPYEGVMHPCVVLWPVSHKYSLH